jgi:hypothetical protein
LFVGISVEGDAGPTYHNITKTKSKWVIIMKPTKYGLRRGKGMGI